jgi:polyisoprenoid-binding protein YceI
MVSKTFDGTISIANSGTASLEIQDISITIGVTTLDSDNRTMNKKTYDALKNDQHPNIYYKFNKVKSMKSIGNNKFEVVLNGTLNIAGTSKSIDILITLLAENNTISLKGEKPMKMSDFNVEPPTALLGTLKTGNDITIEFNLNYL